ncbi:hypothetical protein [Halorubrum vacuolatum]|uniref:Zinc transport system substrate-binding protein n=1 Tax=Halorubrum vacuolatum TaxID=63740 RepID=A0A238Y2N6_HALVU|nr:hypothetical protein [Halorubrum vacuolatum]SNR65051.1 hypothetical protein SAMN06264855_12810 [Halorubrum vacuolatum]
MVRSRRELILSGAGVLTVTALAGCADEADPEPEDDDHSHDDHDHDDHDHDDHDHDDREGYFDTLGIYIFQLLDRAHDPHEEIAYMHDDHWHGSGNFPVVPVGDNVSIGAEAFDEDDNEIELWDEYEMRAAIASGADEDVVSFDFHGDHVHIIGEQEGLTEVVFQVWHDDHADYQSEPLAVQVGEADDEERESFDAHHVSDVEILDRAPDPHEEVADWHGDHWHGELPTVPVEDNVSLGAVFTDDEGNEADLDHDFELRVRLADGADEIVEFDFHGDHVHIIGQEAGETEVVFQLWHDDHADFETDPIGVTVE